MKRFVSIAFLLLFLVQAGNMQAQNPTICRLGFSYNLSRSANWGKGKPVITQVYPYSSAEQAQLKVYDIIEAIDGLATSELNAADIAAMLNPAEKNEVKLTISNLKDTAAIYTIQKDCKRTDAISEDQLATAFAMYSLENTSERLFVCPFTSTAADTVDFALFKTFAFAPIDENNRKLEETINACIEKEFTEKGLIHSPTEPADMRIETFYFYKKNPHYAKPANTSSNRLPAYRYDFTLGDMGKFPFLTHEAAETEAEYLLQLGIRLIDNRYKVGRVVWECEANEMMTAAFRLENYAQTHIPLMCMLYPYSKYGRNVQFLVSRKNYNYTGIHYDINRLEQVMDVDINSPAHIAGIRTHDIIERIDNQFMNHTAEEYTAAYKNFIMNTLPLRDPKTLFADANGFRYCMYWDKLKYTQVMEALRNPRHLPVFAYLYKYEPYVNPSGINTCTFYIKRGKEKKEILIHPSKHTETTLVVK
jgi:hypothetical protein